MVYSVAVQSTPEGLRVVSGSRDRTVRVWDGESGQELQRLEGHTSWVRSVTVQSTPEGLRVVSSDNRTVRVWDGESGQELQRLEGEAGEQFLREILQRQSGGAMIMRHTALSSVIHAAGDERRLGAIPLDECRSSADGHWITFSRNGYVGIFHREGGPDTLPAAPPSLPAPPAATPPPPEPDTRDAHDGETST
jgi:WD40 repeat protein